MSIFFMILAGCFILSALVSSADVATAKQVAFAQVCQMLWAVVAIGLALMSQRASHRWADEGRREKAAKDQP